LFRYSMTTFINFHWWLTVNTYHAGQYARREHSSTMHSEKVT